MAQEVNIVAILYPTPGKVDRVSRGNCMCSALLKLTSCSKMKELLGQMCQDVYSKEDYTLRYMMTEQLDVETPDIVMIETYVTYPHSMATACGSCSRSLLRLWLMKV